MESKLNSRVVKIIRMALGMNAQEYAEHISVGRTTLDYYEQGANRPKVVRRTMTVIDPDIVNAAICLYEVSNND